jgi:hypothetical protein
MTADKIINAFRSNYGKQFNKNFTVSGDLLNLLTIFSSEYNRQTASLSNEEKTKLFRIVMDQFIKETGLR